MERGSFSRALSITWQYKYLWLLGIIASIQFRGGNSLDLSSGGAWILQDATRYLIPTSPRAALVAVAAIIFWLSGVLARAALIHSVAEISMRKKPLGFATSLRQSMGSLFSLTIMQIIVWSPMIIMGLILVAQTRSLLNGVLNGVLNTPDFPTSLGRIWLTGIGTAVVVIVLTFVDAFAFRSITLGRLNPFQGISYGVKWLTACFVDVLFAAIGCGILGLIISFLIGIPFATIASFVYDFFISSPTSSFVIPSLILGVIGAIFASLWTVFQSSVFTLIFIDLVGIPHL